MNQYNLYNENKMPLDSDMSDNNYWLIYLNSPDR